jgi:hypothetical protein
MHKNTEPVSASAVTSIGASDDSRGFELQLGAHEFHTSMICSDVVGGYVDD